MECTRVSLLPTVLEQLSGVHFRRGCRFANYVSSHCAPDSISMPKFREKCMGKLMWTYLSSQEPFYSGLTFAHFCLTSGKVPPWNKLDGARLSFALSPYKTGKSF